MAKDNFDGAAQMARVRALQQQIETHPGHVAFHTWDALRQVHSVMQLNEMDLLDLLEQPNHDHGLAIELFQNQGAPTTARRYYLEMYRLLHNYVASTMTLVDHSRRVVNKESDPEFRHEYDLRKDAIAVQPVTVFVQDLRNYLLHYRLPPFTSQLAFGRGGSDVNSTIRLPRDKLIAWNRWNAEAKQFLRHQDSDFPLNEPVEAYRLLVDDLYEWLFAQFERLHGSEVEQVNKLRDEHDRLLEAR